VPKHSTATNADAAAGQIQVPHVQCDRFRRPGARPELVEREVEVVRLCHAEAIQNSVSLVLGVRVDLADICFLS